jgi:FMN-dependent oxidoreductase (nitrilotriacetate monooxygenase family)
MAKALERACFDYFMIEDSNYVPDVYGGSMEVYLKYGQRAPKHDPAALAAIISQATSRIGIVATMATTEWSPFQLARYMSTLDHMSNGRAGWNMVTGSNDRAAQNFGHEKQAAHDDRYDIADDFTSLVRKLWDSWAPDSVVMDAERGVYVESKMVQAVEHVGPHFASRGPLNTLPAVQGRPVLVQAGSSGRGRDFAAQNADSIIAHARGPEEMKRFRDDVRARLAANGRDPNSCKVLFLIEPVLGETDGQARLHVEEQVRFAERELELGLSSMSSVTTVDMSQFDVDQPLPSDLTTNGHQGVLDSLVASGRPLRELVSGVASAEAGFVGSPDTVAAHMGEVIDFVGGDGFLITTHAPTRRYIAEVADGLVPALQRRGLTRTEYTHERFRDNLLAF